ncbi:unnamed protein product [Polarella glacialis]|uniref:Uncharacterized protein n=1 Tax=Polarella glacialis TaxID=89957 RepID=A0A813JA53_POLGL|nr:unnamed protein product [Polarella glacialis]
MENSTASSSLPRLKRCRRLAVATDTTGVQEHPEHQDEQKEQRDSKRQKLRLAKHQVYKLPAVPIRQEYCFARTWADGAGLQCTRRSTSGSEFCVIHAEQQAHGRIDGEVPLDKLQQFARHARQADRLQQLWRTSSGGQAPGSATSSSSSNSHIPQPVELKQKEVLLKLPKDLLVNFIEALAAGGIATAEVAALATSVQTSLASSVKKDAERSGHEGQESVETRGDAAEEQRVRETAKAEQRFRELRRSCDLLKRQLLASEAAKADMRAELRRLDVSTGVSCADGEGRMTVRESRLLGFLAGNGVERSKEPRTEVTRPTWTFPCTFLEGRLEDSLLTYLLAAPEWRLPASEWLASRETLARPTGFERHHSSVEEVRHCRSQECPAGRMPELRLFGKDASGPAPRRLMAFRHALICANSVWLRTLEDRIKAKLLQQCCTDQERQIFGHSNGQSLNLCRAAFAFATLQLRWGKHEQLTMGRHVDGGASLLHLSIGFTGRRRLRCEPVANAAGGKVEELELLLGPGDVYLSSPACCYHSVSYEAMGDEAAASTSTTTTATTTPPGSGSPPPTLVAHFRSDLLRLRAKPQDFHKSNRLLSQLLAPAVAELLQREPLFRLPNLAQVRRAEAELFLGPEVGSSAGDQ